MKIYSKKKSYKKECFENLEIFFSMKSEVEEPLIDYTPNPNKLGNGGNDLENDFNYGNNVLSSSAEVRKGFLRKVYGILSTGLHIS